MGIEGLGKDAAITVARDGAKALEKAAVRAEGLLEKAGTETTGGLVKDVVKKTRVRKGKLPANDADLSGGIQDAVRKTRGATKAPEAVTSPPLPDLAKMGREERVDLIASGNAPEATLEALASDPDPYVRSFVSEALMGRSEGSALAKRYELAQHGAPREELIKLASDPAGMVREEAASNKKLEPRDIEQLFKKAGDDLFVLLGIAANPKTPEAILLKLAKRQEPALQQAVLHNLSAPKPAIEHLARVYEGSSEHWVEMGFARHPHTPTALLEKLAANQNPNVANSLLHNPSTTPEALRIIQRTPSGVHDKGPLLAKHKNVPPDLLDQLARSGDRESVVAAAGAKGTPAHTLIELSKLDDFGLMEALASNPVLPEQAAFNLAHASYPNVIDRLLHNKVTSPEALRTIEANPAGVWDKAKLLLAHPRTPADVRARLELARQ